MALFMPTFITPSTLWGIGNGVVDATESIEVSWRVNGNSPMTAFRIRILTEKGTEVFNTGKITDGCPFYGVNNLGHPNLFHYTFTPSATPTSEITGKEWTGNGIVSVSVNAATFNAKYPNNGSYTFTATKSGTGTTITWSNPDGVTGITVSQMNSQYGITYSATTSAVNSGDTITVTKGLANGVSNYQMYIAQWWSENDYIEQTSPSAFSCVATPTITVASIPNNRITVNYHTFSATYNGSEPLNYVRWVIYQGTWATRELRYDTGKLYGVTDLTFTYNGFMPTLQSTKYFYWIVCEGQTTSGIDVSSEPKAFYCTYATSVYEGSLVAQPSRGGIEVSWEDGSYIVGEAEGEYSIEKQGTKYILHLYRDSSVVWDTQNQKPLNLAEPWSVVLKTTLSVVNSEDSIDLLAVESQNSAAIINISNNRLKLLEAPNKTSTSRSQIYQTSFDILDGDALTVFFDQSQFGFRIDRLTGGLYPSTTLYPATTLYPRANTTQTVLSEPLFSVTFATPLSSIRSLTLNSRQDVDYLWVGGASATSYLSSSILNSADYNPALDTNASAIPTVFYCDFSNEFNAGSSITSAGVNYAGMAIYRKAVDEGTLSFVTFSEVGNTSIIDYGARNNKEYEWYAFPTSDENKTMSDALISNRVTPRIWRWAILECSNATDDGFTPQYINKYNIVKEYAFSANLSSGTIGNNNKNAVYDNFTQYPTIMRSEQNYKSGTLSALIGIIGADARYYDDIEMRDAIYNLSTTNNTLFLRNNKGDLMEIAIVDQISMTTQDNTAELVTTASIPWVEVGTADNVSIVG